jgi:hypothetical protein
MKPIDCLAILPAAFVLQAQIANPAAAAAIDLPSPGPYAVISRDANSAVWQQETYRQTSRGAIITNIHRYVQLETGLNFWRDGQWNASREEISVSPDGLSASGTNSQHQVYFPGDIYNGVVKLVTPEGQTLESQPIGVALSDGSNTVILAVVTNSTGAILPSGNQVVYVSFDNQFQAYTWTVENNFFDNTTLSPGSGGLSQDHNGYWNTTQLMPTNSNDVVVTNFIYTAGRLGSYYQLSTNLLNQGSTTAAALGLYHHAVTTNGVVEGTNTVSIGFHYVVTDTNGIPLDGNQNGNPDYWEDANGNGIADNGEANWAVAILSQPISQIVAPGSNVTFTATGAGLYGVTYQWQFTNVNISGATNATLTLTNVQLGQADAYDVVVTGNGGMGSVVSSNAYLYLLTMPVITSQTLPTNPVCIYGNILLFSVTATATGQTNLFPFFYQWQCEGTNIPSATTNPYSFTVNDNSSGIYSVIVSNAAGSASASWQVTVTNAINVTNDLLLIYNTNSVDSTTVLNYYLAHRPKVSGANVLGIGCTGIFVPNGGLSNVYAFITNTWVYETVNSTNFTNEILAPVQAWLAANQPKRPQYVILFLDVPSRVDDTATVASNYPFYDGHILPSVSFQLANAIQGWNPFVTHLNMKGTNDCIAYINKLAFMGTNYSPGKLIISAGGYGNTNYYFDDSRPDYGTPTLNNYCYLALSNVLYVSPNASVIYSNTPYDGILAGHITNSVNLAGYMSWGNHGYYGDTNGTYATNGTIVFSGNSSWWVIETIESFNGQRYRIGQGMSTQWFSSNAFGGTNFTNTPVGAVTHVNEPGLGAQNGPSYFGLWQGGKNLAICAWNSRLTTNFQAVGDPFVSK